MLWDNQMGACLSCGTPEANLKRNKNKIWKRLQVHHNHLTGRVVCLLCHSCNTASGHVKDNPKVLEKLMEINRQ